MRRLKQSGDTIVEVLIAILVVSVVLSGAFVSARKSQSGIRQSEERVEALKVAEGQIEQIKSYVHSVKENISDTDEYFCVDSRRANPKMAITGGLFPLANEDFNDLAHHPTECTQAPAEGVNYYSTIEHKTATNTYIVHTRWDGAGDSGVQEVTLAVRIDV